jgi:hypothetical protein
MKFDRFNFEQAIMQCWGVMEDINILHNRLFDESKMSEEN